MKYLLDAAFELFKKDCYIENDQIFVDSVLVTDDEFDAISTQAEKIDVKQKIKAKQRKMENDLIAHLEKMAKNRGYDNALSVRSYAGYKNVYQKESKKFAIWCSACWQILSEQKTATENIVELLPKFKWV